MIQEAIAHVWEKAQEAQDPKFIECPGDPAHVHRLVDADGVVSVVHNVPQPRRLTVHRLADIIELANNREALDKSETSDEPTHRRAVFYNHEEVVLWFDTIEGLEYACLPLAPTDEYAWFLARREEPRQEPRELATALRLKLRRCYDDAKLIEQVSGLRSRVQGEGHKQTSRTTESWGRSVTEFIEEGANLPDPYQDFKVRRYANPDLDVRHSVQFALDPDTSSLTWVVYPLEDAWIDFIEAGVELVGDRLRQNIDTNRVPIYRGCFMFQKNEPQLMQQKDEMPF